MSGPCIILDKSAFQSLKKSESFILHKYFFVNVPPVLVLEIIGDLKKLSLKKDPHKMVSEYAGKLLLSNGFVNTHFTQLLTSSLKGEPVFMDGRPLIGMGRSSYVEGQGKGVVIDCSPELEAVNRWKDGNFLKSEEILAERWRNITQGINLEYLRQKLRAKALRIPRVEIPEELIEMVDDFLSNISNPIGELYWLFLELGVAPNTIERASLRWQNCGYTNLVSFAPYAHHCVRVSLFFYMGLFHNCPFTGTRATNKIDLEYLYYLPFCNVFASGDNFHVRICRVFLRKDQSFVGRDDLKRDLAAIDSLWVKFTPNQKAYIWPPEREGSIVLDLWKKHVAPVRSDDQNLAFLMSKEKQEEILSRLKLIKATAQQNASSQYDFSPIHEPEFIQISQKMNPKDPCPCGSGLPAGQCHLKNIK
ncbi:MAG TPA: SEC-C domain-containing protein [Candidatus Hydrogenedentes bacterium]|nr:SEC-C domain-containing protein [Candidatus Hydrogenedentota bacterium]